MTPSTGNLGNRAKSKIRQQEVPVEHYLRLIGHRKWLILATFLGVASVVAFVAQQLPNIYTSYSVILVDPQKIPESYVRSTVTGDARNRLSALSNQILSATRLQKIIDDLNLYSDDRKRMAREDVIAKMRKDIGSSLLNDFAGNQDLQAFRIQYSGKDPRLVAEVANRLAGAFINENLKNREQQATGTAEFIDNQLQESRAILEAQEAKIKDFNLKHIGQLPEQETGVIQAVSQLQAQLQMETDALTAAEARKKDLMAMLTQPPATVVDMDPAEPKQVGPAGPGAANTPPADPAAADKAQLAVLLTRYSVTHPDVVRLKNKIAQEEARAKAKNTAAPVAVALPPSPSNSRPQNTASRPPGLAAAPQSAPHFNPVLQSQIQAVDAEIAKHTEAQQRFSQQLAGYHAKLDAIPVIQQELAALTRDYEISKARYSQLLDRKMNAETAAELEIRQKGEKFEVVDPAVPAERPTSPNRPLIDLGGVIAGLVIGLLAAMSTEFLGISVIDSQDVAEASGTTVLGVIPVILTQTDKRARRRRWIMATASTMALVVIAGIVLFLKLRNQA